MMRVVKRLGVAAALIWAITPATAMIHSDLSFGGATGTATAFDYTAGGHYFSATAMGFSPSVTLTNLNQLSSTGLQVQRSAGGIGVTGGLSGDLVDSGTLLRHEGILLTSSAAFSIETLSLSLLSSSNPLALYGIDGDALVFLGTPSFGSGSLTLAQPTAHFTGYFFASSGAGQGYRLDALAIGIHDLRLSDGPLWPGDLGGGGGDGGGAGGGDLGDGGGAGGGGGGFVGGVPEPASWAMLIAGFGLVGAAQRRRHALVVAA